MRKRQAHYCERVVLRICAYVAAGSTLKAALTKTGSLAPSKATFWKWRHRWPEVDKLYTSSRDLAMCRDTAPLEIFEVPAATPAPTPKPKPKASWADMLFIGG